MDVAYVISRVIYPTNRYTRNILIGLVVCVLSAVMAAHMWHVMGTYGPGYPVWLPLIFGLFGTLAAAAFASLGINVVNFGSDALAALRSPTPHPKRTTR